MSIDCDVHTVPETRGIHKGQFYGVLNFDDYPNPRIFIDFYASEILTDEAKRVIRQIAIEMFEKGVEHGEHLKAKEIRSALGIEND